VGGMLYFGAVVDHAGGLWRSDGTEAGTELVRELDGLPSFLTAVGSRLFFVAPDEGRGDELWVSDGTAAGTRLLTHFAAPLPFQDPSIFPPIPVFFHDFDGILYFLAPRPFPNDFNDVPVYFQDLGGVLHFLADDVTGGLDLWRSDGTEAGTLRAAWPAWPTPPPSDPWERSARRRASAPRRSSTNRSSRRG
jgi:ELWxxDGT repeat protein